MQDYVVFTKLWIATMLAYVFARLSSTNEGMSEVIVDYKFIFDGLSAWFLLKTQARIGFLYLPCMSWWIIVTLLPQLNECQSSLKYILR